MRKTYKNKRDQYKSEAEQAKRDATFWKEVADKKQKQVDEKEAESKKGYSTVVYCTNCLHVNDVLIPPGVKIDEGDCVTCRVRGTLKLVITYPNKF